MQIIFSLQGSNFKKKNYRKVTQNSSTLQGGKSLLTFFLSI
jgi:hypothetical protein